MGLSYSEGLSRRNPAMYDTRTDSVFRPRLPTLLVVDTLEHAE